MTVAGAEVSGQRELADGELPALAEAEEQAVLGEAELPGPVCLAPAQPSHGRHHAFERAAEMVERLGAVGGHAATASARTSGGGLPLSSLASRAARSARSRMMQGTMATAVSPPATQKAVP